MDVIFKTAVAFKGLIVVKTHLTQQSGKDEILCFY